MATRSVAVRFFGRISPLDLQTTGSQSLLSPSVFQRSIQNAMNERVKVSMLGGCLCGQFKYRLGQELLNVNNCHCIDCRRASAAPFVTWGSIQARNFEVRAGELKRVKFAHRVRSFAACCHTPILFQDNEDSEWLDVTIVSLDDPGVHFPAGEIWTEDKLPWIMLNPELPKFPQGKS